MKYGSIQRFTDVVYVLLQRTTDVHLFTFSSCVFSVVLLCDVGKQHICMKYGSIQRFNDVVYVLLQRTTDVQVFYL